MAKNAKKWRCRDDDEPFKIGDQLSCYDRVDCDIELENNLGVAPPQFIVGMRCEIGKRLDPNMPERNAADMEPNQSNFADKLGDGFFQSQNNNLQWGVSWELLTNTGNLNNL